MPRRSELTVEQRREAVLALLRKEEPATQLARRFGVSEQTLYRWRDEFLAGGRGGVGRRQERDRCPGPGEPGTPRPTGGA